MLKGVISEGEEFDAADLLNMQLLTNYHDGTVNIDRHHVIR